MAALDFPLFDGHMHFSQAFFDEVLASYDECGITGGINLWNPDFHDYAEFLQLCRQRGLEKRFIQFYWPDWRVFGSEPRKFAERLCADMRRYAKLGARGLKVWKDLGMFNKLKDNSPSTMDDERLEPVWRTAAELKWTIAVHQADPSRGFKERCKTGLTREEIFKRRDKVIAAHPEIPFILCHSGNDIEDFGKFAAMLDRFPNLRADLRQPARDDKMAERRAFMEKYAHRLFVGPDLGMPMERPPDRPWNRDECYTPWRQALLDCGLSKDALEKIAWRNGEEQFLKNAR